MLIVENRSLKREVDDLQDRASKVYRILAAMLILSQHGRSVTHSIRALLALLEDFYDEDDDFV